MLAINGRASSPIRDTVRLESGKNAQNRCLSNVVASRLPELGEAAACLRPAGYQA